MEAAVEKVGWCKEKNIGNAIQDQEMKAQVGFKPTPSSTLRKMAVLPTGIFNAIFQKFGIFRDFWH